VSRPVRVCFVSPRSYALFNQGVRQTFGGAEVQLYLLAITLARDPGFEVHFVTGDHGQAEVERHGALRVHRGIPPGLPAGLRPVLRWGPRLARIVWRTGADVVVQRAAGAHTGLLRLLTWATRQRFVYMVAAGMDCDGGYERGSGRVSGWLYRLGLRRADLVVSQTEEQRQALRRAHRRESVVIPSVYAVPDEEAALAGPRDSILWVGRCEPGKRPEAFIELARRFPGERFVMVAPPVPEHAAYYGAVCAQAGASPNVEHVDFVPFRAIDAYFRRAKAFVLTSAAEGFPNTFVQAAANGTPILSLSVDPDGFLARHDCGAAAGDRPSQLVDLLGRILRDPALWDRQARNGWKYARTHHDVGPVLARHREVLDALARTGPSRTRGQPERVGA
jgi:glycosyltransferase involved in cell wall biosynthesis